MSQGARAKRLCLVGATGLVGMSLIEASVGREDVRIVGVARREARLPSGARMEMLLADPSGWADAIAAANAQVLVCALGTTMRKVKGDEAAFRAVDHDLVLKCARAAKDAGIDRFILVSSVGADAGTKNVYIRTKGEIEAAVGKLGFKRYDIIRPSLLLGHREESRPLEKAGRMLGTLPNLLLHGKLRKFRSIRARTVADAIIALSKEKAGGRFVHEFDAIHRLARRAGD